MSGLGRVESSCLVDILVILRVVGFLLTNYYFFLLLLSLLMLPYSLFVALLLQLLMFLLLLLVVVLGPAAMIHDLVLDLLLALGDLAPHDILLN